MAVTILHSTTTSDGICYHAISVIGSRSEVVVQAYEPNEVGVYYLCGSEASSEQEAIAAVAAIASGDESHWGYKLVARAQNASRKE